MGVVVDEISGVAVLVVVWVPGFRGRPQTLATLRRR
jgi:hypothetical protein